MSSHHTEIIPSVMKPNGTVKASLTNNNNISHQQKSTSRTEATNHASDVRVYFKQSDGDTSKFRCLLCSVELTGDNSSPLFLANHLRSKHAIERDSTTSERNERAGGHQQSLSKIKKISRSKNSQVMKTLVAPAIVTHHKHQRFKPDENGPIVKRTTNTKSIAHDEGDLRRNLDLFDYDDPFKASLKPLPSASLSRNLFARLNQLSEPVTRKLKFWNKKSFQVNSYDPCFKVIYLGNLGMQYWSKDESCLEKPLNTLWNNYLVNMKTEIVMRLTICNSGLKAITRQHGLTQYWSNRLVYCCSHKNYPKVFSWIYRHEGKKMRQELRCHAVFCSSPERAAKMVTLLNQRLACALQEFRREKKSRGVPSIVGKESLASSRNPMLSQQTLPRTIPLRRQILAKGSANFRPPLERSKSAPKLMSIREEDYELEEEEDDDDELSESDAAGEDSSHDEYEYEQSFGERDDEEEGESDLDELGRGKDEEEEEDGDSSHKLDSNSMATTANEETSNSSVYATGDISYDNIMMNKQHLAVNQERLDCASTLTAPAGAMTSSFRRSMSTRRSTRMSYRPPVSLQLQRHDDATSTSPTNSIEVDLNQFEPEEEEEEDEEVEEQRELKLRGLAAVSCHNPQTSANNTLQQESTSSSNHSGQIGDDQQRCVTDGASGDQLEGFRAERSAVISSKPKQDEQQAAASLRGHHARVTGKPNVTDGRQKGDNRQADHDDPATRDIILSWSNNLSIK